MKRNDDMTATQGTHLEETCTAGLDRLKDYYNVATNQCAGHSDMDTICDLQMNLHALWKLWPGSAMARKRYHVKNQ